MQLDGHFSSGFYADIRGENLPLPRSRGERSAYSVSAASGASGAPVLLSPLD